MITVQLLQWATFLSLLSWLLVYWQAGLKILADIWSASKNRDSRTDLVLLILMAVFSFVITMTAFLTVLGQVKFGFPRNLDIPVWLTALGCLLTILGIAGTFFCRHHLGQFWTAETALKNDRRVMDQGAYGIVRHPIYTFSIILYIGLGLVFATWWNILCAAGVVLAYMLKAKDEEAFLEHSLAGYVEYKERVRYRLIPRIW